MQEVQDVEPEKQLSRQTTDEGTVAEYSRERFDARCKLSESCRFLEDVNARARPTINRGDTDICNTRC